MKPTALVTDAKSLPIDYDMPLLLEACAALDLDVEVCEWDDASIDWSQYAAVVLRSPWDYTERSSDFLQWCGQVDTLTQLINPLRVIQWGLDKHYLADLAGHGVPVVQSQFVETGDCFREALGKFFAEQPLCREFVVKPTVGSVFKGCPAFHGFSERSRSCARLKNFCRGFQRYSSTLSGVC